ncbi:MAG: hypothetical protein ACRCUP_07700 [Mycoplasmatales bacterium]
MIMKNIDIFEKAVELHSFQGSRSTLNNWINVYSNKVKQAYIKRIFNCGKICEFDCGNVTLIIGEKEITIKIAVFCLPFSNYRKAYLYEAENTDAFLDSHMKFFREIGCIPTTIVYDNMRVAIAKFIGKTEKRPTKALSDMASFYGFKFRFCNIYSGNEKGSMEKLVDVIRRKALIFSPQ